MARVEAPDSLWSRLGDFVAERMGLHFPRERWPELQRGVAAAAHELGITNIIEWAAGLLVGAASRAHLDVLASQLTVGETYFFRDPALFDALANRVMPELIQTHRGRDRRLRLWSAACCTGEEAYSLAMFLHERLPDLGDWHVTILATDINPIFLRKAVAGVYTDWSFRSAPAWVRTRYCTRLADGRYAVQPKVKRLVRFAALNLVDHVYPSVALETNAMDVILCRNALMYFTPEAMRRVVARLHRALIEGGWLAVSASEASHALFAQFTTVAEPDVILYRKTTASERSLRRFPASRAESGLVKDSPKRDRITPDDPRPAGAEKSESGLSLGKPRVAPERVLNPLERATGLYGQGRYAEAIEVLLAGGGQPQQSPEFVLLVRALANEGRQDEARAWCERWIARDKVDPLAHYFRAVVLFELGAAGEATRSLQRALYLRPDFVVAHLAAGNAARAYHQDDAARRHYANALQLLIRCPADEIVAESDGLTAGRLAETIVSLMQTRDAT